MSEPKHDAGDQHAGTAAISIRRVARLSRNVSQPDHILANSIISHKAQRRPGSGEMGEEFAIEERSWSAGEIAEQIRSFQTPRGLIGARNSPGRFNHWKR